jgi:transposase
MRQTLKYPRLTPWEQVELLERAAGGESLPELARVFGLHRATVCRLFAKYRKEATQSLKRKERHDIKMRAS